MTLRRKMMSLLKAAETFDVRVDFPLIAGADEIFDQKAGGEASVNFDALVAAGTGAFDHLRRDVGAEDFEFPAGEKGKILAHHHGEGICLLAAGTGGGPKAERSDVATIFDDGGEELIAEVVEGRGVAKEAGFVDGHCLGDRALEHSAGIGAEGGDKLGEGIEATVAEQALEARFEEVVAGRVDLIA
jgi:hypothetical protein